MFSLKPDPPAAEHLKPETFLFLKPTTYPLARLWEILPPVIIYPDLRPELYKKVDNQL